MERSSPAIRVSSSGTCEEERPDDISPIGDWLIKAGYIGPTSDRFTPSRVG